MKKLHVTALAAAMSLVMSPVVLADTYVGTYLEAMTPKSSDVVKVKATGACSGEAEIALVDGSGGMGYVYKDGAITHTHEDNPGVYVSFKLKDTDFDAGVINEIGATGKLSHKAKGTKITASATQKDFYYDIALYPLLSKISCGDVTLLDVFNSTYSSAWKSAGSVKIVADGAEAKYNAKETASFTIVLPQECAVKGTLGGDSTVTCKNPKPIKVKYTLKAGGTAKAVAYVEPSEA